MPLAVACPACGKKLKAPDGSAGKRVKCPHCGDPFTVTGSPATSVASGAGPATRPTETVWSATESTAGAPGAPGQATGYTFLGPAQGPGELGRLGPYRGL